MATPQKPGRPNDQKNDQYQKDLNPDPKAGFNIGSEGEKPGRFERTAADIVDLRNQMEGYSSDDLNRIPVLKPGTRLEQGAKYINLKDPARQEFVGMASDAVDEGDYIVPKSEVEYELWNRLAG
jgi:hypothetical protein